MSKAPRGIARFDSAAAMVAALASALHQQPFSSPSQSPTLDRLLPALNRLPDTLREWGYAIGGMAEGVTLKKVQKLDVEGINQWMCEQYPQRDYPAAFIGSSNGAMVHLASAMGVPWLPQTFLCPVHSLDNDPDDAQREFEQGRPVIDALLAVSPHLAVHHMQDPNQDRLMRDQSSWFRLKQRRLTLSTKEFLLSSLPPGSTLIVNHCRQSWPVTRTNDRACFQFGALGGASEQEYFNGGPRVAEYLARYGVDRDRWQPPEPNARLPEAEWGFDPALLPELRELAADQNWTLLELSYEHPEDLSFVTAEIYRDWYIAAGILPTRLVVDNFLLMDPWVTQQLHAIPFWLVFCTEPSADNLQRFLDKQPPFNHIDMLLFSHGNESIGMAPIARWQQLLDCAKEEGAFVGADAERYPRDFATLSRFDEALQQRAPLQAPPPPLALDKLISGIQRYGEKFGVTLTPL